MIPHNKVYLIGAGPGDPELLTIKAARILGKADCILYDSLVHPDILNLAPATCKNIFVGKRYGKHSYSQEEINNLLLTCSKQYKVLVRLKGGDPFIFGRGGEELEFLAKNNIQVESVPGITASLAAAATLSVSLTHRDYGQSVIFLSGYTKENHISNESLPHYDWNFLANSSLTLVFYMSLINLEAICNKLIECGKNKNTGVVIISNCTLSNEKIISGVLETIVEETKRNPIEFPAILIIGDVVSNRIIPTNKEIISLNSKKRSLIILFHGAKKLNESLLPTHFSSILEKELEYKSVHFAYLADVVQPSLNDVFEENKNIFEEVDIFPLFILPGKHLDEDIPELINLLQEQYISIKTKLLPAPNLIKDLTPTLITLIKSFMEK